MPKNKERQQDKNITIKALRAISKKLNLNASKCNKMLFNFGKTSDLDFGGLNLNVADFSISERSLRDYLNGDKTPEKDNIVRAINIWLRTSFPKDFNEEKIRYLVKSNFSDISALNEFFLGEAELSFDTILALNGKYRLYRPSHVNPDTEISIVEINLGVSSTDENKNYCSCDYISNYFDEDGETRTTFAKGHFVTNAHNGVAFFKTEIKKPLILMIDFIQKPTSATPQINSFAGIILAGVTTEASAWPFYAERVDDPNFKSETVPYDQLKLKKAVIKRLSRGSIRWNESIFIGWPNKKD